MFSDEYICDWYYEESKRINLTKERVVEDLDAILTSPYSLELDINDVVKLASEILNIPDFELLTKAIFL